MAMQHAITEEISSSSRISKIMERVKSGSLKFFISRDTISHEKVYLLENNHGNQRVITGSANLSYRAFNGIQRENIICFDDSQAFAVFKQKYDTFKEECSDCISYKALLMNQKGTADSIVEEVPETIPIIETLQKDKDNVIILEQTEEPQEAQIIARVDNISSKIKPLIPAPSKGKTILDAKFVKKLIPAIKRETEKQRVRTEQFPNLFFDMEAQTITFNDKPFNMFPSDDEVRNDVDCFLDYMDGFDNFSGNISQSKRNYFQFMNWFFASPFMPYLRKIADSNRYDILQFPVYSIIYGISNAGKTAFAKLLSKMMCGQFVPVNSSRDFTQTKIDGLKQSCKGLPIIIDDIDKTQYKAHSGKVIKYDRWGLSENLLHYPGVVITSNELPSIKSEISKRAYVCHIDTSIDKDTSRRCYKKMERCLGQMGTAFYRRYAREMFTGVNKMSEKMKIGDESYLPDIFALSSNNIRNIIAESRDVPDYAEPCLFADYLGDKAVGKNAISKIRYAWKYEPANFMVDKRKGVVEYHLDSRESYKIMYLVDEIPKSILVGSGNNSLIFKTKEAGEYFNIDFKPRRKWFGRYREI